MNYKQPIWGGGGGEGWRQSRGRKIYERREKRGRIAGFPGEIRKHFAKLRNLLKSIKRKVEEYYIKTDRNKFCLQCYSLISSQTNNAEN